jgi:SAM-dependent methyltransferase
VEEVKLKRDEELERSPVVANCRMNRERELAGSNGYDRELRLRPVEFLRERLSRQSAARWLDLCCGTSRALVQAAELVERDGLADRCSIVGVDLVEMFWPAPPRPGLRLVTASAHTWEPDGCFDLITCVHGLHYLGDKLGLVARAARWLVPDGVFVANLDLANLRAADGGPLGRAITTLFASSGIAYDRRKRLLTIEGRRDVRFPFAYLGADDAAGPNSTGQAAVDSRYQAVSRK